MTESERLRPHPSTRLAGPVVPLGLHDLARALHAEPHPAKSGHRQTGLVHRGPSVCCSSLSSPAAVCPSTVLQGTW